MNKEKAKVQHLSPLSHLQATYKGHMQPNTGQIPRPVWRRSQRAGVQCLVNIFGPSRETEQLFSLRVQHEERQRKSFSGNTRVRVRDLVCFECSDLLFVSVYTGRRGVEKHTVSVTLISTTCYTVHTDSMKQDIVHLHEQDSKWDNYAELWEALLTLQ